MLLHADSEDSDQTGWIPRLIRVFAGCTGHFVGFVMLQLKYDKNEIEHTSSFVNKYSGGGL